MRKKNYKVLLVVLSFIGCFSSVEGALKITQIMYNMRGDDGNGEGAWEWVEIYNDGDSAVDLTGYVFDDVGWVCFSSPNITSGSISASGFAYLYNEDAIDKVDFIRAWGECNAVGVTGGSTNFRLSNRGDKIGLWSSISAYKNDYRTYTNVVDSVAYGSGDGDGWPSSTDGCAIYLRDLDSDNTVAENWALASEFSVDGDRVIVSDFKGKSYAAISMIDKQ